MCGICGKLAFEHEATASLELIQSMADAIRHRGPDDDGYYVSGPVALGFRRLSIIDLAGGHQPLSNEDQSIWIVFNGEIYNYRELREYLLSKGHILRTHTDTEVIVHLYEEYGGDCVEKLRGMFAFALWDNNTRTLLLARDRVGIKPLYYRLSDRSIVFASEIKAILADPSIDRQIDPGMIDRFLTFFYLPGEETLLRGISKLAPGHYLLVRDGKAVLRQYWDLPRSGASSKVRLGEASEELESLLAATVDLHMIADVPVGILLSGGVDSTAVLSLAAERIGRPISTFTVGFSGNHVPDERPYARLAAERFGTKHHEMTISAEDFAGFLPTYVWHMEEPVCEPPALALYYVSRLARRHVTVLLSGEGGDEAFAGYSIYRNLRWLERVKRFGGGVVGRVVCAALGESLHQISATRVGKYLALASEKFPDYYYSKTSNPYRMNVGLLAGLYSASFRSVVDLQRTTAPLRRLQERVSDVDVLQAMLYLDTKTWLPDDLLLKADKITMANSLELRVPLLDHRILEFAASLPSSLKISGLATKRVLKKTMAARIPRPILQRKKAGFPVPYGTWLRHELRSYGYSLLEDRRSLERGYFRKDVLRRLIDENARSGSWSKEIFSLMVLELWHRLFLDQTPGAALSSTMHEMAGVAR
jgi:asparagine synthase (glutamine-hydrolysing)